ncbi:MAG: hypothetical protein PETM_01468 [Petrimonas sp.]|jgi:hypothetical protein
MRKKCGKDTLFYKIGDLSVIYESEKYNFVSVFCSFTHLQTQYYK